MKRFFLLSFISISLAVGFTQTANAQPPALKICFTDGYYKFLFGNVVLTSETGVMATGTVDIGGGTIWNCTMTADFSSGWDAGTVQITTVNPNPDGCTYYTDSFTYFGTAKVHKKGSNMTINAYGNWESYCFGGVLNTGTWAGKSPCSASVAAATGTTPARSQKNIQANPKFVVNIMPNPVNNYTQLKYTVNVSGKVSIVIYNAMQQVVKVLVNENMTAGTYTVSWNTLSNSGSKVPNGIYKVVAVVGNDQFSSNLQVVR